MKRIIIMLLMLLPATGIYAQEAFAKKIGSIKNVSAISISKTMLSLMPNIKTGNNNLGNVARKLDRLEILDSEDRRAAALLKQRCLQVIQKEGFETLMTIDENGEQSDIYMKESGKGKNQYVLISTGKSETSVIVLTGNVTLKEIKNVMGH